MPLAVDRSSNLGFVRCCRHIGIALRALPSNNSRRGATALACESYDTNAGKNPSTRRGFVLAPGSLRADQAAAHEMVELSGQMGVPFTVITKEDGKTAGMVGFNQAWLARELSL